MGRGRLVVCLAAMLVIAKAAAAQEPGQIGLTMGYPGTIGVVWHPTSRIALEPDIAFSRNRTTFTSESTLTVGLVPSINVVTFRTESAMEGWAVSPGIRVRFYLGQ